jgi:hypothetical protein
MKNIWLDKSEERHKFILAGCGIAVTIYPHEVKEYYPLGMGAGTRIILKNGKEYLVSEHIQKVREKLQ